MGVQSSDTYLALKGSSTPTSDISKLGTSLVSQACSGLRVQVLAIRVQGTGFGVWDFGHRISGLGFRVQGLDSEFGVQGGGRAQWYLPLFLS